MLGVLRKFFGSAGTSQWIVLGYLLLAGLAEGVGLAGVLPLLRLAFSDTGATGSPINAFVLGAFDTVDLSARFEVPLVIVVTGIIVRSPLIILAMRYVGYPVADVATNLRTNLIRSLLDVQWNYFTRQPVGRFANAVSLGGCCRPDLSPGFRGRGHHIEPGIPGARPSCLARSL